MGSQGLVLFKLTCDFFLFDTLFCIYFLKLVSLSSSFSVALFFLVILPSGNIITALLLSIEGKVEPLYLWSMFLIEPRRKKTGLRGFRPGQT